LSRQSIFVKSKTTRVCGLLITIVNLTSSFIQIFVNVFLTVVTNRKFRWIVICSTYVTDWMVLKIFTNGKVTFDRNLERILTFTFSFYLVRPVINPWVWNAPQTHLTVLCVQFLILKESSENSLLRRSKLLQIWLWHNSGRHCGCRRVQQLDYSRQHQPIRAHLDRIYLGFPT